jgi:hypothetical protein
MVAINKSLLEIVQGILSDIESDPVNSISDTEESDQITDLVITTYFDMIADKVIPDNYELFRFDAVADSTRPTHLRIPSDVSTFTTFKYNKTLTTTKEYREVYWMDPHDFVDMVLRRDSSSSSVTSVPSVANSVDLLVYNDQHPRYYTSFDNDYIVCDAHYNTLDTTLQNSKTMGYGEVIPTVTRSDSFQFDMGQKYFPLLIAEAKSRAFINFKGMANPKEEQIARQHKAFLQKEKWRLNRQNAGRNFGRT